MYIWGPDRFHGLGIVLPPPNSLTDSNLPKEEYIFPHILTPERVEPYSSTVFVSSPFDVTNVTGRKIVSLKDTISDFALSPAGTAFLVLTHPKKGTSRLNQYLTSVEDRRLSTFDVKHLGVPTAAAYTPDGRRIIVATEKGARIVDARKMTPLASFEWQSPVPTLITVSPNDFFLAATDGNGVAVYNLQTNTLRKVIPLPDVKVTDMVFSPDSKQLGVLTDDGLLTIYDTRSFNVETMIDDLGEGISFDFNDSGKYIAVVTSPDMVEVVNLVKPRDRQKFAVPIGGATDIAFIKDASGKPLLIYGANKMVMGNRLSGLEPYFAKLVSDEVDMRMTEWMKMQPGESMEAYRERMSEDAVTRQRRLFEDEISTRLAGDPLSMEAVSLGNYNRDREVLALEFSNMPTIYLPVPSSDIQSFHDASDIEITDVQYGLLPDDSFEIIYAVVKNKKDGKTYVYDNVERVPMTFLANDHVVLLDVLQQQQMEVMKLEEIKQRVMAEAKQDNIISDNTSITVDSQVTPDYNANGDQVLNYTVKFTYEVEPGFSTAEDFGPGRYLVEESGAAMSMLSIVKQAFEGDLAQYMKPGGGLIVNIYGAADATPIVRGIPYDGSYGEYEDEPIFQDGTLTGITVTKADGIKTNEQLAFLRALGVKHYLESSIEGLQKMNGDYRYNIRVSPDKGSEHRRITTEFTFTDVF